MKLFEFSKEYLKVLLLNKEIYLWLREDPYRKVEDWPDLKKYKNRLKIGNNAICTARQKWSNVKDWGKLCEKRCNTYLQKKMMMCEFYHHCLIQGHLYEEEIEYDPEDLMPPATIEMRNALYNIILEKIDIQINIVQDILSKRFSIPK